MSIDLEKVDAVIDRTGVSYKDAKQALEKNNENVLDAIVYLEEKGTGIGAFTKNVEGKGEKLLEKLKEILKEGNVNKITVKKDGEVIANIPINVGAIGFLATPLWATVGITAAILTKHTIEITKEDGEVIDLKQASEETIDKAKSSFSKKENQDNNEDNNDDNDDKQGNYTDLN